MTFLSSPHRVIISMGKEVTKWGSALQNDYKCHVDWTASSGLLSLVVYS